jgi:ABC-type transporter Mla subunit MlaD
MSQAVIDFCDGLKAMLLGLEDKLGRAQASLASGAASATEEANRHLSEAAEQVQRFKTEAAHMAESARESVPQGAAALKVALGEFGQEAQVALRHAAVLLAESAARATEGAAGALQSGARQAQRVAEALRHETAVTAAPPPPPPQT